MRTRQLRARHGFTLIEVLIVIAIVGLLAAILFPVFSRVREKGRSTVCLSNLRQIGLALDMYIKDNNNFHPAGQNVTKDCSWIEGVKHYAKSTGIFQCPSAEYGTYVAGCPAPVTDGRTEYFTGSYLLNLLVDSVAPIRNSRIREPSNTIFVTEGESKNAQLFFGARIDMANEINTNGIFKFRHNQGSNNLFVDGHVKWLSKQALSDIELWTP